MSVHNYYVVDVILDEAYHESVRLMVNNKMLILLCKAIKTI